ncbi:MAG: choice-of-anchor J domain-containing protein [Flavobacteriales bacterium]|nr:choice-of-anchor J domain-containing protein [Flavobacteriales bacterium]MBP9159942.1 choice-of-anchor J domain-containing protein [Flavobacteriales bacterium]
MRSLSPVSRTLLLALPLLVATAIGCKKEYDTPPVRTLGSGNVVTIAQLKAMYQGSPVHFSDSANAVNTVYAVVTADEQNGNLYKNVYVQDNTGAIAVRLLFSGGLYQGDSIRIYLPGTVLSPYNGLMQIDSVNVDNNIVKQATGVYVAPTPTTMTELATQAGLGGSLQSKLITLSGVEFIPGDTGLTYADPVNQLTLNRTLENCSGGTAVVRSSGYGNFAGTHLPTGKGTFTGIASWFGSAAQLYVRDINEVQLDGPRCGVIGACDPLVSVSEDFSSVVSNSAIALDCWTNTFTAGSVAWRGRVSGSDFSAEARISLGQPSTMWLVTPQIIFSGTQNLSFSSAMANWVDNSLTAMVSTNFTGDVNTATWTPVTGATIAGQTNANDEWVPSGNISLASFLPSGYSGNFVVAFKYEGTAANSTTYRVDNVAVN